MDFQRSPSRHFEEDPVNLALTIDPTDVWKQTLSDLQLQIRPEDFQTWFREANLLTYDGSRCVVGTRNPFAIDWLNQRCRGLVGRSLTSILGQRVDVEFVVQTEPTLSRTLPELSLEAPPLESSQRRRRTPPPVPAVALPSRGHARFTFDSFVVGSSNQLAHAACAAVADQPGEVHNPLFIYGGVGLGKTHLLRAIGHEALARGCKVVYISAETFIHEFISSIGRGRMEDFRNRYREADYLLVDDVQFIAGKEQTQDEFFHTFNALHEAGRQIVLTSDRYPRSLATLTRRLQSRFEGGLIADIQEPDLETRIAILDVKWRTRAGNLCPAPIDALTLLAEGAHNGRELEGVLNRARALAGIQSLPLTLEIARQAVSAGTESAAARVTNPTQILKLVSRETGISTREIQGPRRDKQTALARQVSAYLLRECSQLSLAEIGALLGGRDHSTIAHSHEKVTTSLASDQQLHHLVAILREAISPG